MDGRNGEWPVAYLPLNLNRKINDETQSLEDTLNFSDGLICFPDF